jgi:cytochrome c-type biogenesis protein CcmH/NrfG
MASLTLPAAQLATESIVVRRLRPGEAAMMPVRIRAQRGVSEEQAKGLLPEARAVAARYPNDPAVLATLAEAEYGAGNDGEAVAAADAALARDPRQVNAFLQKALALFRMAGTAPDQEQAYAKAWASFAAVAQLEPDHPLPPLYYYQRFVEQGQEPTQAALDSLRRACDLAPFDLGVRMLLAVEQVRHHRFAEARRNLGPIAGNPHGDALAAAARRVLARMDADPAWNGQDVAALAAAELDDTHRALQ